MKNNPHAYVPVQSNLDMRPFNTLRLKSRVAHLMTITDPRSMLQAIAYARARDLQIVPLGSGSNVVLPPHWKVLCLHIKLRGLQILRQDRQHIHLKVAAGENWHALVEHCLNQQWFGLERLALIPGCCGAAPIQNIGAYGVDLSQFLTAVEVVDLADGAPRVIAAKDCGLGYRTSYFKQRWRDQCLITAIHLKLHRAQTIASLYESLNDELHRRGIHTPQPRDLFEAVCAIRRARLPSIEEIGNVGSFFQNPTLTTERLKQIHAHHPTVKAHKISATHSRLAAATLLEICGWKGFRAGDLGVYPKHALCLVNYGHGDKAMVLALAEKMQNDVWQRFALRLAIEPRIY